MFQRIVVFHRVTSFHFQIKSEISQGRASASYTAGAKIINMDKQDARYALLIALSILSILYINANKQEWSAANRALAKLLRCRIRRIHRMKRIVK
jgi:hypothetical protein